MKKILLLVGIILIHTGIIFAQDEPYIADFYNNKDAAITITFDDATYGQYEYAFPTLKKYGLVASFGVTGEWVCQTPTEFSEDGYVSYVRMSKNNLLELWRHGNEISWHGLKHQPYDGTQVWIRLDKQLRNEIVIGTLLLNPIPIYSIFYPYSSTNGKVPLAVQSSGFLFGRTAGEKYNEIDKIDYYLLKSFAITNNDIPSDGEFREIIDNSTGRWCILMYHHIITDTSAQKIHYDHHRVKNSYAISPERFDLQMKIVSDKDYWVGTIFDVARYLKQKEESKLVVEYIGSEMYVTIECELDPDIYNHEMTVIYGDKIYNIVPNNKVKIN